MVPAEALATRKGEVLKWLLEDKHPLILWRTQKGLCCRLRTKS